LEKLVAPETCKAANASIIPAPESLSTPAVSISMADEVRAVRIWAWVAPGAACLSSAAMAAACGAAAEFQKTDYRTRPHP
jgi:hypothetical protein